MNQKGLKIIMTIREIIKQVKGSEEVDFNSNFIEAKLFDSLDIMAMVVRLEQNYGCRIKGIDILPENFESIATISELVRRSGGMISE